MSHVILQSKYRPKYSLVEQAAILVMDVVCEIYLPFFGAMVQSQINDPVYLVTCGSSLNIVSSTNVPIVFLVYHIYRRKYWPLNSPCGPYGIKILILIL